MPTAAGRTSPHALARELFAGLPPRYDRLANILSLGQDRRWRRAMIDRVAAADPGTVLDVATGPAGVALELANRTGATIVGIDLSDDMLAQGRRNVAAAARQDRITLALGQAEHLPFPDATFDAVTFTYLLRYVSDPAATVRELARVIVPGGHMASLEFAVPHRLFWRGWWWVYTRVVLPLAGAALGGRAWFEVGRFLGPSIAAHDRRFPLATLTGMWEAAGLTEIGCRRMSLGGGLVMWARRDHGRPAGATAAP